MKVVVSWTRVAGISNISDYLALLLKLTFLKTVGVRLQIRPYRMIALPIEHSAQSAGNDPLAVLIA